MELSVEFTIPNTPLFRGAPGPIIDEELRAATEYGLNLVQGAIVPRTPVHTGALRRGWITSIAGKGVEITGRVVNPLQYALPVETGSRPHFPPSSALERWVRLKLGVSEKEVKGVAFVIARAISKRGTKAHWMARDGLAQVRDRVLSRYEFARDRIIQRLAA